MAIRAAGPGEAPVDVAVTMRTPGHDEELAAGFLFSEGLVRPGDLAGFELGDPGDVAHPDNEVTVRLSVPFDASAVAVRHFVASASCGICGKASLDAVALRCPRVGPGPVVGRSVVLSLPGRLRDAQRIFEETGGLHAAGLFTARASSSASARTSAGTTRSTRSWGRASSPARCRSRTVCSSSRVASRSSSSRRPGARACPILVRRVGAVGPRGRDRGAPRDDPRRVPPRRRLQRLRGTGAHRPRRVDVRPGRREVRPRGA